MVICPHAIVVVLSFTTLHNILAAKCNALSLIFWKEAHKAQEAPHCT